MQKIAQFIMSKKFIPVILTITAICLFINFQSQGKNDHNDNPKEKHSKVLKNVRILLEDGHFSPQKIDDIFSKKVLKKFLCLKNTRTLAISVVLSSPRSRKGRVQYFILENSLLIKIMTPFPFTVPFAFLEVCQST